jgi:Tol biopolymer transport system component
MIRARTVLGATGAVVVGVFVLGACTESTDSPSTSDTPAIVTSLPPSETTVPPNLVFFDSDRNGNFELHTMNPDGSGVRQVTNDDRWDSWWPRISPDREQVLFYRTPAGVHDLDFTKTSLWVMTADGSTIVELRPAGTDGWQAQGHAEWSPDGERLVMFGGRESNSQIFVTTATGREPRAITDRGGVNLDPSWSPDGQTIAFIGCPRSVCFPSDYEVYTIAASGSGEVTRLTEDDLRDHDPYYSPDGTQLAWLTQTSTQGPTGAWNIRVSAADGSGLRRLTDDSNINSKPEWSGDGTRIFFHRLEIGRHEGFSIFSIALDGTDLVELTLDQPGVNEFPSI